MDELEVTWRRAIKVWWSLIWPGLLFGMLAGFVAGVVVGFVYVVLGLHGAGGAAARLAGLIVGIPVGGWVVKIVPTKQITDYRPVLVAATQ